VATVLLCGTPAAAQQGDEQRIELSGMESSRSRVRSTATESWGAFDFNVINFSGTDRNVRVLVFYEGQPDVQYGRDLWVPARSEVASWLLAGPANAQRPKHGREIQMLLFDRTSGTNQLVLPRSAERVRSRMVPYRKREPFTTLMVDEEKDVREPFGRLPGTVSPADEALVLVRTFRLAQSLSEFVPIRDPGPLTPAPEAFDGIDHFVISTGRISEDPAGVRAMRQWLHRGGRVWVMLDRVDPQAVAGLLGDALDFEVVDRVGLTHFEVQAQQVSRGGTLESLPQEHERPVTFTRVLLPAHERPRYTINGWPMWFTRQVGRGRVLFTTLGPRGWHRERKRAERSPYENFPHIPVPLDPFNVMADEFTLPLAEDGFAVGSFQATLTEEIGYSIASRYTAALIFGGFVLATLGLGLVLRRSQRAEWLGWLAPAGAIVTAGVFFFVGESSRRAVPATVAAGQVVDAGLDGREAAVRGLLALYRPDSGPAPIGTERGGLLTLDVQGLEGQARQQIMTDLDAWHFENLTLPAGVRMGSFQSTIPISATISAVARFGRRGIEGKLSSGPFRELRDAVLHPADGRNLAIQLGPDGAFSAGPPEVLSPGQFLAGSLLSDEQQRRQEVYRDLLAPKERKGSQRTVRRDIVLAWARPIDMPFKLAADARTTGTALLVVPLRLERPAEGEQVLIPGPFIPYRRVLDELLVMPPPSGSETTEMDLRFQLPDVVLPFKLDSARVVARIEAPSRRVTLYGQDDGKRVEVHHVDSPLDPIRVDITQERLLRLDKKGGLRLTLGMGKYSGGKAAATAGPDDKWSIRYLEVEVTGRTLPEE
jgi:hypothetical protein